MGKNKYIHLNRNMYDLILKISTNIYISHLDSVNTYKVYTLIIKCFTIKKI